MTHEERTLNKEDGGGSSDCACSNGGCSAKQCCLESGALAFSPSSPGPRNSLPRVVWDVCVCVCVSASGLIHLSTAPASLSLSLHVVRGAVVCRGVALDAHAPGVLRVGLMPLFGLG